MSYIGSNYFQKQNNVITLNYGGVSVVFFSMQHCGPCNAFKPFYEQLAQTQQGVNFFICDLTTNRDIVQLFSDTRTYIRSTPMFVLYIQGVPRGVKRMDKNTPLTGPSLMEFIQQVTNEVKRQAPPPQMQQPQPQQQQGLYGGMGMRHSQIAPKNNQFDTMAAQRQRRPPQVHSQYATLGDPDDEDDKKMLIPPSIIAKNEPWRGTQYD